MYSEGMVSKRWATFTIECTIMFLIFRLIAVHCTCIRYREISTAATEIHSLVEQNLKLFSMEQVADSSQWLDYVGYVDNIVSESLLKTVGCRYVLFYISSMCRRSCETYDTIPIMQG